MQDEQLDDIIREAANAHQPSFDEEAWTAMRQQLDRHLPLANRRRRYGILLLWVVAGGIAYIGWPAAPKGPNASVAASSVLPPSHQPLAMGQPYNKPLVLPPATVMQGDGADSARVAHAVASSMVTGVAVHAGAVPHRTTAAHRNTHKIRAQAATVAETGDTPTVMDEPIDTTQDGALGPGSTVEPVAAATATAAQPVDTVAPTPQRPTPPSTTANDQPLASDLPSSSRQGKGHRWVLLLSAGGERSHVRWDRLGKTTLTHGLGLGYALGRHWMIRAGFYQVEKIYSGGKEDYSLPPQFANNPYLYQIDGRCRVQEIPVSIVWKTDRPGRHQWLAAAGLASIWMKTEQYEYHYKNTAGLNYTRSYGVQNENQHYFSLFSLSAGYLYRLNKHWWLMAEPYARIPLQGVGLGKVKLHSLGLLFTVAVSPFAR